MGQGWQVDLGSAKRIAKVTVNWGRRTRRATRSARRRTALLVDRRVGDRERRRLGQHDVHRPQRPLRALVVLDLADGKNNASFFEAEVYGASASSARKPASGGKPATAADLARGRAASRRATRATAWRRPTRSTARRAPAGRRASTCRPASGGRSTWAPPRRWPRSTAPIGRRRTRRATKYQTSVDGSTWSTAAAASATQAGEDDDLLGPPGALRARDQPRSGRLASRTLGSFICVCSAAERRQ